MFRQHNGKRKRVHRLGFQGYMDCVTLVSFLFSLTIVQLKIPTFEKMIHVKHLADVPHNSISILWMSCPPLLFRQEKCPKALNFWFRRIIRMGGSQANIAASFSKSLILINNIKTVLEMLWKNQTSSNTSFLPKFYREQPRRLHLYPAEHHVYATSHMHTVWRIGFLSYVRSWNLSETSITLKF